MWSNFILFIICLLITLLVIRISEITTRMKTFEMFIAKAATYCEMTEYVDATLEK
jgi:hypothetical protein